MKRNVGQVAPLQSGDVNTSREHHFPRPMHVTDVYIYVTFNTDDFLFFHNKFPPL